MDITKFSGLGPEISEIINRGLRKKVGCGNSTFVWTDILIGGECLKNKFPRLFSISVQKECIIADMGSWQGDVWQWNFIWRQQLFAWDEQLVTELFQLIN